MKGLDGQSGRVCIRDYEVEEVSLTLIDEVLRILLLAMTEKERMTRRNFPPPPHGSKTASLG